MLQCQIFKELDKPMVYGDLASNKITLLTYFHHTCQALYQDICSLPNICSSQVQIRLKIQHESLSNL